MNTASLLRSSLLVAVLASLACTATASETSIDFLSRDTSELSADRGFRGRGPTVALGERRESVVAKIGQPDFKLTPNGWVYRDVHPTVRGASKPALRNLVIVFLDDRVASIRVASDEIVDVLVADVQRAEAGTAVATLEPSRSK